MSKKISANSIGVKVCDFCNGEVRPERVTMTYKRYGKEYVVEDVPAEVCQKCGEKYYHARTLDEVDRRLGLKPAQAPRTAA